MVHNSTGLNNKNMGVCICAAKNTGIKYSQNEITTQDEKQIQNQMEVIMEDPVALQKTLSKPPSMNRILSIKQKTHSELGEQLPYQNWTSLKSNRSNTLFMAQKTLSYNSNTGSINQSNVMDLEEKQRNSDQQAGEQIQLQKKIQTQTAKNRNWTFNRCALFGQGMRQQDNALIQRTQGIDSPIKLQAIQLKNKVTYHGQWINGMRHGNGIQVWEEGSRYQGQWEDNQMNGYGKLVYFDGDEYEGEWKDDQFHGHGKYTCQNGHSYEGQWTNGKKQGRGTQVWEDGEVYAGQFKDGFKHGRGLMKFKDGSFYEGEFSMNEISGRGKYVWKNSRQYDGDWVKNKMCGFGILKWSDGRYYKGQFLNDKRHGKGQMYYTDGSRYVGNWNHGKEDGHGQIYQGVKLKFVGQWKDGKKVKKNNKYESSSTFSR